MSGKTTPEPAPEAGLQIKVWLKEISAMTSRRVLVPASFTLEVLHGLIQVAMQRGGFTSSTSTSALGT